MSTVSAPVLPAATSAQTCRARDRARGDASGAGGQDFAAVLDGHLAASKKPGGSKPNGAKRDDRHDRDESGPSSASASPAGAVGQVPNPSGAARDGSPTTGSTATGGTSLATTAEPAGGAATRAGSSGTPAQGLLAADGNTDPANDPADAAGADLESSGAAGQVSGLDGTLAAATSADELGTRAGQPADQSPADQATAAAAGDQPTAADGAGAGDPSGADNGDAGTAVETIALAGTAGAAGPASAQAGRSDADDEGVASDALGQLTTPSGVTSAPATAKPDGARGTAPTTAAPATPVVAQVAPAVARVVSRGDGEHRMMLKLHPADLGEIHLTVTVRGDHVDVDIAAGSTARDLLRDGSAHLRSLLESIGRSPGQLVLRDLPSAPPTSPAATAGGAGPDTGSGAASYAGEGTGHGDTGRDQPGTRGGAPRPEPLSAARDTSTRTTRTTSVLGGSALDVTV